MMNRSNQVCWWGCGLSCYAGWSSTSSSVSSSPKMISSTSRPPTPMQSSLSLPAMKQSCDLGLRRRRRGEIRRRFLSENGTKSKKDACREIEAYSVTEQRCGSKINERQSSGVFDEMPVKEVVSWNAMPVEERFRNSIMFDLLFVHQAHPLASCIASYYAFCYQSPPEQRGGMNGYMWICKRNGWKEAIPSPVYGLPNVVHNQVWNVTYFNPPPHKHIAEPPKGVIMPAKVFVSGAVSGGEYGVSEVE